MRHFIEGFIEFQVHYIVQDLNLALIHSLEETKGNDKKAAYF